MGDMQNKLSIQSYLRRYCLIILLTGLIQFSFGQLLPGFQQAKNVNEQEIDLTNVKEVTININSPLHLNSKGKTYLVIFALPNGNSIEWTKGKKMPERRRVLRMVPTKRRAPADLTPRRIEGHHRHRHKG